MARAYAEGKGGWTFSMISILRCMPGEIVALVGPSGSGKSSLLHIAGLLEAPTAGEVFVAGQNCTALDDTARTRIRRIGIGFVYQFHHLLPEFSALENVDDAATDRGRDARGRCAASVPRSLWRGWGSARGSSIARPNFPAASSSAWRSPARIANRPLLLLADEPTGNLDPATAARVHEEILRLIREEGLGALVATHNLELARRMTRVARLEQGRIWSRGSCR